MTRPAPHPAPRPAPRPAPLEAPLPPDTLHVVVDMQQLFDSHPDWGSPALRGILPNVLRLVRHRPERALYTRFLPPRSAQEAAGRWKRYYERWPGVCLEACGADYVELLPELQAEASRGRMLDKPGYSAFQVPAFAALVEAEQPGCLLLSGVETDMCVLATLLQAVDLGLRVVVATDAVASGEPEAHAATLALLLSRLDAQVEGATTDTILENWR